MSSGYFCSRAGDDHPESLENYVWFGGLWGETVFVFVRICSGACLPLQQKHGDYSRCMKEKV